MIGMRAMHGIEGMCAPKFSRVEELFRENFARGDELGATFVVYRGDELVVDLWGGVADDRAGRPWAHDTPCPIFSSTKAVTATTALLLWDRGLFDVDAPVNEWWPEFGRHGKEHTTAAHLLSHQAGLPYFESQLDTADAADPERLAALLADQAPVWAPGTAHGYHSLTYGWLVGEIVRRLTGRTVGGFLREAITGPRELDLWIGAPSEVISRTAIVGALPPAEEPDPLDPHLAAVAARFADPHSLVSRSFASPAALNEPGAFNNPAVLGTGWPAISGLATGLGLAGFYRDLLAGRILSPDTLRRAIAVRAAGTDRVFGINLAFGLGYLRSCPPVFYVPAVAEESVFGHFGAGGAFGFGDHRHGLAIVYLMNGMRSQLADFSRAYQLIEAVYAGL